MVLSATVQIGTPRESVLMIMHTQVYPRSTALGVSELIHAQSIYISHSDVDHYKWIHPSTMQQLCPSLFATFPDWLVGEDYERGLIQTSCSL